MKRKRRMPYGIARGIGGAVVLAGCLASPVTAADDPRGAMLAETCNGCHGPAGTSRGPAVPTIAGTNHDYLLASMRAFRSGARPSTIMGRIARAYDDDELALIADHFSALPFGRVVEVSADEATLARGKAIYDDLCEDCHENRGVSNDEHPMLAGQMAPYLVFEIHDFLSGARDLDKAEEMSGRARRKKRRNLTEMMDTYGEDGVAALAVFFASQKK